MTEAATNLEQAIEQAAGQYYRLVILVGSSATRKTTLLQAVARKLECELVNVNLQLSQKMLELTRTQRPRQVDRLLKEAVAAAPGGVVLLDNLEILFDPALEIAPLRLLQSSSRNRIVVATWSGTYRDGTLTYAEPGHPEFKQFKQPEAIVVTTGNENK